MRGDRVDVALTANWFLTKTATGIRDCSKQEHAAMQLGLMFVAANVHDNAVHEIGTLAVRIAQAGSNRIELAMLGLRSEDSLTILKNFGTVAPSNSEAWIERHRISLFILRPAEALPAQLPEPRHTATPEH
jgi:hypothetical protein